MVGGSETMEQNEHFRIIEADASHVDFLSDFGRESFIDAYKETLSQKDLEAYTAGAFSKSNILDEINNSTVTYFICTDLESNLCGYSKLIPSSPPECVGSDCCIELQRLYVDERYKGQGMGKRLLMHAESKAMNKGFHSVWLRVWKGNGIAQMIYLKANYSIIGEERYQVGKDGRTVILMRKTFN
jgi:ribosomal protein S18 acetylase RimI-like enzyme